MRNRTIAIIAVFVAAFVTVRVVNARNAEYTDSMDQARALMSSLQANNFDLQRIDRRLLKHPDQALAESKSKRNPQRMTFELLDPSGRMGEALAFVCDIYVKMNPVYEGGDSWKVTPTGYFIVGYRDGTVAQVPVADVRYLKSHDPSLGGEIHLVLYPGMRDYDSGVPFLDFWKS
jgi:hypothetical protein